MNLHRHCYDRKILFPLLLILLTYVHKGESFYFDSKNNTKSNYALLDETNTYYLWGGNVNDMETNLQISDQASTRDTFAVVLTSGTVKVWGNISDPGISNAVKIYANNRAYVAVLTTSKVKCWGKLTAGGNCNNITSNIVRVFSTYEAFAAITSDANVVSWGNDAFGGDSMSISNQLNGTIEIYSTDSAFAARFNSGYMVCWGNSGRGGSCTNFVSSTDIKYIYSTAGAFAVQSLSDTVKVWGASSQGGDASLVSSYLSAGVLYMCSGETDFVAYTWNSVLVSWGGRGAIVKNPVGPIISLYANSAAFVAMNSTGYLTIWGDSQYGGGYTTSRSFSWIYANKYAFVGVTSENKILCWGDSTKGGSCSSYSNTLVKQMAAIETGFLAVTCEGDVVSWGDYSGSLPSGIRKPLLIGSNHYYSRSSLVVDDTVYGCEYSSSAPTRNPTSLPPGSTPSPTSLSSITPTNYPTTAYPTPSVASPSSPSFTNSPTVKPVSKPTEYPSTQPTLIPSSAPTLKPSPLPTLIPTYKPSAFPTFKPSSFPTTTPTFHPTSLPTGLPTSIPTEIPTSQPTSIPSSTPTSAPSCPKLYTHADGTTTCYCKAGYYTQLDVYHDSNYISWSSENTTCRACPFNSFTSEDGMETCRQCDWPETTRQPNANTMCNGYCLCFSQDELIKIIPPVLLVFILCISLANDSKYALGIVLFFPTLDVLSDVLYLSTTLYYSPMLCFLSVVFLLGPSLIWLVELKSKKAYPTALVWPFPEVNDGTDENKEKTQGEGEGGEGVGGEAEEERDGGVDKKKSKLSKYFQYKKPNFRTDILVISMSCSSSTPLYQGIPIKPFFTNHDGIPHLLSFFALWIGAVIYQLILIFLFFSWLFLSLFFQFFWFFIGIFLHLTKLFSIGRVQTFWLYLWTGTNKHECDRDVDIGTLNRDMLAEFLIESLPQLLIQSINNQLTHKWTTIGWISAGLSMFVAINGTYRMLYWMLWMKVPIDQVQMGMALKVLGAKSELHHPNSERQQQQQSPLENERGNNYNLDEENGVALTTKMKTFGDAKIVPMGDSDHGVKNSNEKNLQYNQKEESAVLPFLSIKSLPIAQSPSQSPSQPHSLSQLQSMPSVEMKMEDLPTPDKPNEEGRSRFHSDDNEKIWRGNIWELLTNPDSTLNSEATKQQMANVGLSSMDEIRYLNEEDIEKIGSTLKAIPRRKLRYLWGGRLIKTHTYLQNDQQQQQQQQLQIEGEERKEGYGDRNNEETKGAVQMALDGAEGDGDGEGNDTNV